MTIADAAGLAAWLAARAAAVPGLRDGCAARILWAGAPGDRTPLSLVYVHGFSASGQELRPLPDLVADRLGANLFLARLTGHGQDGAALGRAVLADWQRDVAEALSIGAALGDRVIVMACSTGAPLVARALAEGAAARAVILVSPNWGLRNRLAQWLLDAPGARLWGRWIMGPERAFEVLNADHAAFWTTRYPSQAVHEMAAAVRAGWTALPGATAPAFVAL
ncbi:MAG: Alpha/beta hydrolase family, partial [Rhodobacteraceae bacterium HLUCCO18]